MDIAGTLASVSAALGLVKELRSIDAQFDKAELKLKIADLTESLSEAKLGLVDVAQELQAKDAEIANLKEQLQFRAAKLVEQGSFRYFADEHGKPTGVPICPVCEKKGLFLKLAQDRSKGAGGVTYACPSCKANYGYSGIVARA
ncbi:hypothetical protein GOC19_06390 [Sinorhizobium meliloti]|uniref:hypothetical protein n=1 Tax=Rhizobium meliloti TaxID=382 RepID=UPI0018DAD1AD|nr:hypothetical protein [Sinorhizobium meliloti]MDW9787716.1 hypothetical protein [Sinorhizobium meliloti]MDX0056090.1 hypothetical protein [Sinorhizobium meliloti]QPI24423.1 hypothetical protein I0J99_10690 [Sinorhizobium meliloti]